MRQKGGRQRHMSICIQNFKKTSPAFVIKIELSQTQANTHARTHPKKKLCLGDDFHFFNINFAYFSVLKACEHEFSFGSC